MALPPVGLPPLTMVAACPAQPRTKAFVVAGIDPLAVNSDFTVAQLRTMGKASDRMGNHTPYGFYFGAVAFAITPEIANPAHDVCKGPVAIRVTLLLTERRIEVAQDMHSDACRLPKILAHYRHHADADESVFQRYVLKVKTTLSHIPSSSFANAYRSDDPVQNIARAIQAVTEPILRAMDAERAAERMMVDTPAEVQELESSCIGPF